MSGCFSRNEVVIGARENGFPGPAVALDCTVGPLHWIDAIVTGLFAEDKILSFELRWNGSRSVNCWRFYWSDMQCTMLFITYYAHAVVAHIRRTIFVGRLLLLTFHRVDTGNRNFS